MFGARGNDAARSSTLRVGGMSCKNCARKVTESIEKLSGVESVDVNVKKGVVRVQGAVPLDDVKKAIENAGYTLK
jgi:copper chaperone CopZ